MVERFQTPEDAEIERLRNEVATLSAKLAEAERERAGEAREGRMSETGTPVEDWLREQASEAAERRDFAQANKLGLAASYVKGLRAAAFEDAGILDNKDAEIATLSAKLAEAERERDEAREQHKDFVVAVLGQSREECLAAGPRDEHDDFLAHIKKLREQAARVAELEKALTSARQTILDLKNSRWSEAEGTDEEWVAELDAALAATKEPKQRGID